LVALGMAGLLRLKRAARADQARILRLLMLAIELLSSGVFAQLFECETRLTASHRDTRLQSRNMRLKS
jgi:hypothetical protein